MLKSALKRSQDRCYKKTELPNVDQRNDSEHQQAKCMVQLRLITFTAGFSWFFFQNLDNIYWFILQGVGTACTQKLHAVLLIHFIIMFST